MGYSALPFPTGKYRCKYLHHRLDFQDHPDPVNKVHKSRRNRFRWLRSLPFPVRPLQNRMPEVILQKYSSYLLLKVF